MAAGSGCGCGYGSQTKTHSTSNYYLTNCYLWSNLQNVFTPNDFFTCPPRSRQPVHSTRSSEACTNIAQNAECRVQSSDCRVQSALQSENSVTGISHIAMSLQRPKIAMNTWISRISRKKGRIKDQKRACNAHKCL